MKIKKIATFLYFIICYSLVSWSLFVVDERNEFAIGLGLIVVMLGFPITYVFGYGIGHIIFYLNLESPFLDALLLCSLPIVGYFQWFVILPFLFKNSKKRLREMTAPYGWEIAKYSGFLFVVLSSALSFWLLYKVYGYDFMIPVRLRFLMATILSILSVCLFLVSDKICLLWRGKLKSFEVLMWILVSSLLSLVNVVSVTSFYLTTVKS